MGYGIRGRKFIRLCVYVSVLIRLVMIAGDLKQSGSCRLRGRFHKDKIKHVTPSFTPVSSPFFDDLITP